MAKSEFQEITDRIDARLEAMGQSRAAEMLQVFELLSASFAKEENRPSVFLHGVGERMVVLAINTGDELGALEMLLNAHMQMHEIVVGDVPPKEQLH